MITVQIPRPKLRIFKCTSDTCSGDGAHWVLNAGRVAYSAESWHDALALALALIKRDVSRRSGVAVPSC